MTRVAVDEAAKDVATKAPPDFVFDGHERFIPPFAKLALGRTWSPALTPSTVIERVGPVVLEWRPLERVLGALRSFAGRQDLLGAWSREELKAVDAARAGKPLRLAHGNPRRKILEMGTDAWLERAFDHLTMVKGLMPREAYEELARVRGVGVAAMAMKFSGLRDAADKRLRKGKRLRKAAAALGWTSGLEVSRGMKRRRLVERRKRKARPDPHPFSDEWLALADWLVMGLARRT